jgi:hypothetical protein
MTAFFLWAVLAVLGEAHVMWTCPTPRSQDSGLKMGPCGGVGSITDLPTLQVNPGPMTVLFTETIYHSGSPYRISLSVPGSDTYDQCILLNHIPHQTAQASMYAVTINIPNIQCSNCALQLIEIMTDKISSFGTSGNSSCVYNSADTTNWANGQCGSNYHSCANIAINGTQNFSSSLCTAPSGWNFSTAVNTYSAGETGTYNGMFLNDARSPTFTETHYSGFCSSLIVSNGGSAATATGPGFLALTPAPTTASPTMAPVPTTPSPTVAPTTASPTTKAAAQYTVHFSLAIIIALFSFCFH